MKRLTLLVGLLVVVLGPASCTSTPDSQANLVPILEKQGTRIEQLENERESLREQVRTADGRADQLKAENEKLKEMLASQKRLDTAATPPPPGLLDGRPSAVAPSPAQVPPVAALPVVPAEETKAPEVAAAPLDASASIEKVQSIVADLEAQIVELQPKVIQARSKVTNLCRATVDVKKSEGGELICGRPSGYPPGRRGYYYDYHVHNASCYRPFREWVEPGTFRTQHDKDEAIRVAIEEKLPFEQMLLKLRNDLEKAKQELGRLRRAAKP